MSDDKWGKGKAFWSVLVGLQRSCHFVLILNLFHLNIGEWFAIGRSKSDNACQSTKYNSRGRAGAPEAFWIQTEIYSVLWKWQTRAWPQASYISQLAFSLVTTTIRRLTLDLRTHWVPVPSQWTCLFFVCVFGCGFPIGLWVTWGQRPRLIYFCIPKAAYGASVQ